MVLCARLGLPHPCGSLPTQNIQLYEPHSKNQHSPKASLKAHRHTPIPEHQHQKSGELPTAARPPPHSPTGGSHPNGNTPAAGVAVAAVVGVPKLKVGGNALLAGVLKEKGVTGWLLAGVGAALPNVNPEEGADVKEKPVAAVVLAVVFGVLKEKPPPAGVEPKLNWFMVQRRARREARADRVPPGTAHAAPQAPEPRADPRSQLSAATNSRAHR